MPSTMKFSSVESTIHLIDAWLEAEQSYKQLPGLSVGLVLDQELIWSGGYGYANPEKQVPATANTLYSICSISKIFTSIAIMQLRDSGSLRLTDPVKAYLPWFQIEERDKKNEPITVQSLLTHSSGLPRESDFPYWSPPHYHFPDTHEVKERLDDQSVLYPPETYWQYSNLGFTLAGEIVAVASGMPYADYVGRHILDPLDLHDTRPYMPQEMHGDALAVGHTARKRNGGRDIVPIFEPKGITAAAGFTSNVNDLASFVSWQFRTLADESNPVLSPNTLREMHRTHWIDPDWKISWGLGFSTERDGQSTLVGHSGACPGYLTDFVMDSKKNIAAIVLMNACGDDPAPYSRRSLHMLRKAVSETEDIRSSSSEFSRYVGHYDFRPWGGELFVFQWRGQLAVTNFPTANPMRDLITLNADGAHRFRRVRDNDEGMGETYVFNIGANGEVESLTRHSSIYQKLN